MMGWRVVAATCSTPNFAAAGWGIAFLHLGNSGPFSSSRGCASGWR